MLCHVKIVIKREERKVVHNRLLDDYCFYNYYDCFIDY